MKNLIAILWLIVAVTACNKTPKSVVEARFERHIRTMANPDDFVRIDSIVLNDSISYPSYFERLTNWRDSLQDSINDKLQSLTAHLEAVPRGLLLSDAIEIANKLTRIEVEKRKTEAEAKEKLSIFLEDYPDNKCYQKISTIYATFKDGQKVFYAREIAFEDTITISDNIDEGRTKKLQRLEHYFDDYAIEAIGPRKVLLEDISKLSNKINK